MAKANLRDLLRHFTNAVDAETEAAQADRQLVEQFLAGRDEASFQALLRRHGAMVYRVCWRVLQQDEDAEDAFQATFLVLAQKLRTVRKLDSLASWLHGVALRVALKARARAVTRRRHQEQAGLRLNPPPDEITWTELRTVLDAELARLPERWRLPLILCYLEDRTQDEAARQLGWSKNTFRRRLDEGRAALGRRLKRRGVVWPAAFSPALLADCSGAAAPRIGGTVAAVRQLVAGQPLAPGLIPARVAAHMEGVLKAMFLKKNQDRGGAGPDSCHASDRRGWPRLPGPEGRRRGRSPPGCTSPGAKTR